jgi:twitching motility two-component system response regulator PilH
VANTKILIVDDSPTERFYLADLLSKKGYQVVMAADGEEAILKSKSEKPNVILMDVVMPGQNGFQTTRAITRDPLTQSIPILLCSTKSNETDRIWGLRQGARDDMVKPVKPDDLLAKIAELAA